MSTGNESRVCGLIAISARQILTFRNPKFIRHPLALCIHTITDSVDETERDDASFRNRNGGVTRWVNIFQRSKAIHFPAVPIAMSCRPARMRFLSTKAIARWRSSEAMPTAASARASGRSLAVPGAAIALACTTKRRVVGRRSRVTSCNVNAQRDRQSWRVTGGTGLLRTSRGRMVMRRLRGRLGRRVTMLQASTK